MLNKRLNRIGLILSFNHQDFVIRSLESFLNQTLKLDYILIIDDASSDMTPKILKNYQGDKKVRIILNKKNVGPSNSLNAGLNYVWKHFGDSYVFAMSADDFALRTRVQIQNKILEDNKGVSVLLGNISENNKVPNSIKKILPKDSCFISPNQLFFKGNFLCAPTMAIRIRSFIGEFEFDRRLIYLQDFKMWIQLSWQKKLYYDNREVIFYNEEIDSLSKKPRIVGSAEHSKYLKEIEIIYDSFFLDQSTEKVIKAFDSEDRIRRIFSKTDNLEYLGILKEYVFKLHPNEHIRNFYLQGERNDSLTEMLEIYKDILGYVNEVIFK